MRPRLPLPPHSRPATLTALAAVLLGGCGERGAADAAEVLATPAPRETASPAVPGSAQPNLSAADGRAYLSWLEPAGEERHVLRFSVWEGGAWSAPLTVAEGERFFANWADFPSLVALGEERLAAHWLVKSGPGTYAYDVHVAQSADGGRTWSAAVVPHRDGTQTEHGFVSLFPWEDGRLAAVWLDGRNYDGAGEEGADMTLRHAVLGPAGEIEAESLLDERVCDCCQTAVALTARGPLAVYRDRSAEEVRDIHAVRFSGGRWSEPRPVHADGWEIGGCPVNGPAVAAEGERAVVAWFTAAGGEPRVQVAFSGDAGESFGAPLRVDDGEPEGRVDVLLLDARTALVSWVERVGDGAEIRVRRVTAAWEAGPATVVTTASAARAGGFPRMARVGEEVLFAWTDAGDPTRVRTAALALP